MNYEQYRQLMRYKTRYNKVAGRRARPYKELVPYDKEAYKQMANLRHFAALFDLTVIKRNDKIIVATNDGLTKYFSNIWDAETFIQKFNIVESVILENDTID